MKKNVLKWALPLTLLIAACNKDDDAPLPPPVASAKGIYVLSEGGFGSNNTKLAFYNIASSSVTGSFFEQQNPSQSAGLGDTGNDMIQYGSKLYILMNVSGNVTVLNASDAKLLSKISFTTGAAREPRYAIGANGKVFVTCYNGQVAVIDTTSLTVTSTIAVGANPEGITQSGNNLYVANSGGVTPGFDSTVSVISLGSLTQTAKIKVGTNPQSLAADNAGNIYVACTGNYANIKPKLVKLNTVGNTITKSADTTVGKMRFYNNQLFVTGGYNDSRVRTLNTTDFAATSASFVKDGTTIQTPYGISVDDANGDVYITDAKDYTSPGSVTCFDKDGKKKFSFSVSPGVNPNKVLFIR